MTKLLFRIYVRRRKNHTYDYTVLAIFRILHVFATIEFPENLSESSRDSRENAKANASERSPRRRENPFIHGSLKVDCT